MKVSVGSSWAMRFCRFVGTLSFGVACTVGGALAEVDRAAADRGYFAAWGLEPEDPRALNDFAIMTANAGDLETARRYFERALAADPFLREALYGVAVLDLKDGRTVKGTVELRRLASGDDDIAGKAHQELAKQAAAEGRPEAALSHLRAARLYQPESLEMVFNLGQALVRRALFEEAAELFESISRENPESPMARVILGQALWGLGRDATARANFEAALVMDVRQPRALVGLAQMETASGDRQAAKVLYTEALASASARSEFGLAAGIRRDLANLER